jgi:hypothetical protein
MSMNFSSRMLPWWVPERAALSYLAFWLSVPLMLGSITPKVQSMPYGVAIYCSGLGLFINWALKAIQQNKPRFFSEIPEGFLMQWKAWIVILSILLPLGISGLANGSILASWNPLGYWVNELKLAREEDCTIYTNMVKTSAEHLQVKQNLYAHGNTHALEVTAAADVLKIFSEMRVFCIEESERRIAVARLHLIVLSK